MKKLVALACSALMLATVVTGCGGDKPADDSSDKGTTTEKTVMKFDAFEGGNGREVWEEMEKAFEAKNENIDVQLRFENDLPSVLQKENATGTYSDLVYYNLGQPSQFTETQLQTNEVLDITDVFTACADTVRSDFAESAVSKYLGDGKNYLAPISFSPTGLFYSKTLFAEKGYEVPTTWDELYALGDKAKADRIALFTYPTAGYFDCGLFAMLGQQGILQKATQFDPTTWTSTEGRAVLDNVAKLVSADYLHADTVSNSLADGGFTTNQQNVIDGKALFCPNGTWLISEMAGTTPEGFEWGFIPYPANKGGKQAVYTYTEQCFIPKQAANPEAAKEFLKFIYSEEGATIMAKYNMAVPINGITDKLAEDQKIFYSVFDDANVNAYASAWAAYDSTSIPDVDLNGTLINTINDIATGNKTVDEWATALTDVFTKIDAVR